MPLFAMAGQAPSTSTLRIVTKRESPPILRNADGLPPPVIVTLIPYDFCAGAPCHLPLPSMATPVQLSQLRTKPPPDPPARRIVVGSLPFASLRMMIALLEVPLQLRTTSGPRIPAASV